MKLGGDDPEDTLLLLNLIGQEQAEFRAFAKGVKAAFNHSGTFDGYDEFEKWLYQEWDDYREGR